MELLHNQHILFDSYSTLLFVLINMLFYDEHFRSPLVDSSTPVSSSFPPEVLDSAQIPSNSQPHVKSQGKLTRK